MASQKADPRETEVPDIVHDPLTRKTYMKGRFLGKVCNWERFL